MRYGISALLIGTALLSACSSNDSNDDPLAGHWISESCDQLTNADGDPVSAWGKTRYEFWNTSTNEARGSIFGAAYSYDNADCTGEAVFIIRLYPEDSPAMAYSVLEHTTADNGLPAWRVRIQFQPAAGGEFDLTGIIQLANDRLCLPGWLMLRASKFGIGTGTGAAIDYNYGRCLIRD